MEWCTDELVKSYLWYTQNSPTYSYCRIPSMRKQLSSYGLEGKFVHDVATGTGTFARMAKSLGAKYVLGTDISQGMIQTAQCWPHNPCEMVNEYRLCSALTVPTGCEEKFDVVTAAYLTFGTAEEWRIFAECIYNQLKPNGGKFLQYGDTGDLNVVISTTPEQWAKYGVCVENLNPDTYSTDGYVEQKLQFLNDSGPSAQKEDVFQEKVFTSETIERAFTDAGFVSVKWIDPTISEEGKMKYGSQYWHDFLLPRPKTMLFEALK